MPSFSLSMFYMNSLTSGIIGIDTSRMGEQISDLRKSIMLREAKLKSLREEQELLKHPIGHEGRSLEAEIKDKRELMHKLEEEREQLDRLKREYSSKGHGAAILIKSQTSVYPCRKEDLQKTAGLVLNDLQDFDNVIKNRARQGFNLVVEVLPDPTLGFSAEALGLFEPHALDSLVERFPELKPLREQIDSLFVHRWAKDARIGERTYERSAAMAQGIASLLKRATGKGTIEEPQIREPIWNRLPFYDEKKRLGFLGFVHDAYLEPTKFPLLFDYDQQALTNTAVVGSSGYGKTITAYVIAEGTLLRGIPVLVLDPTGQWTGFSEKCDSDALLKRYRDFQMEEPMTFKTKIYTPASEVGIPLETNLLSRPLTDKESELQAYAIDLSMIIRDFCKLSDTETVKVRDTIFNAWKEKKDLDYQTLMGMTEREISKIKLQALVALSFLFEGKGLENISLLWKEGEISVVTFTEIKTESVRMFSAYYLIRELVNYFDSQTDSDKIRLLLVVEEAHRFRETAVRSMLDRAARSLRKKGVGVVFVTQVLTDLEEVRANAATRIYMRTIYEPDVDRARDDMGSEFANLLSGLEIGTGIVSYPSYEVPVVVKFRPCLHNNTSLTAEEIKEKMLPYRGRLVSHMLKAPEAVLQEPVKEDMSNEDSFFNELVVYEKETGMHPTYTIIMERLGWKSDKIGSQVKKALIDRGKIREEPNPNDKRSKLLLPM